MSFWGSHLFFGRVHFILLTIHTFFLLQCLHSLHPWALPKMGIFVYSHFWVIFVAIHFFHVLRFWRAMCRPRIGHQAMTFCMLGEVVVWMRSNRWGTVCREYVGNGFEEMKMSCRHLQGEEGVCCCSRRKSVFFIAREERWLGEKTTGGKYEIVGEWESLRAITREGDRVAELKKLRKK